MALNDYIQLEYIESTGTQYITLVSGNIDSTYGLQLKYSVVPENDNYIAGSTILQSNRWLMITPATYNNTWCYGWGGTDTSTTSPNYNIASYPTGLNNVYEAELNYLNSKTIKFANNSATTISSSSSSFTNTDFYLFKSYSNAMIGRIYYARLSVGSTLTMDLIPVKRKSDDVIGLYDKVNDVLYTNQGTGTFIAGPNVISIDDFRELHYIKSDGTQYINTLVIPTQNTNFEAEIKFGGTYKAPNDYSTQAAWIGQTDRNTGEAFVVNFGGNSSQYNFQYTWFDHYYQYNGDSTVKCLEGVNYSNKQKVVFKDNKYYYGDLSIDTHTRQSRNTTFPIYIFGQNETGTAKVFSAYSEMYLYKFKIYNGNTLIRDYIPVKRIIDGKVGLYDLVNDDFYISSTEKDFIAGPVKYTGSQLQQNILEIQGLMSECNELCLNIISETPTPPTGYTELEYIQSSRTQFIDTGISTDVNVGFEIDFQVMDTRTDDAYFGARNSGVSPNRYGCLNYNNGFHMMLSGNAIWNYTVDTNRHKCSILFNGNSYTAKFDNNTSTGTLSATDSGNFGLFGYNYPSRDEHPRSAMRLYSAKLYTNNTTLVRDLIPVKRNEDNMICLYDKVSNTYFTNVGTGTFIAGPEIN